jgi:ribosomal protein L40E
MGIMNEPVQTKCPKCGWLNPWRAMYCRRCGKVWG